jgi:hypothetical protein
MQLTQRAVLGALQSFYGAALARLERLPLACVQPTAGEATPRLLKAFEGLADELLAGC